MRKLRLAIVSRQSHFRGGGSSEYLFDLLQFFASHDVEIDCLWTTRKLNERGWLRIPSEYRKLFRLHVHGYLNFGNFILINPKQIAHFFLKKIGFHFSTKSLPVLGFNEPMTEDEIDFVLQKLNHLKPDSILASYYPMAEIFQQRSGQEIKLILTHDVWHQKLADFDTRRTAHSFHPITAKEEGEALSSADIIIAISKENQKAFQAMVPQAEHIVATKAAVIHTSKKDQINGRCLFIGTRYTANVQGLKWFLDIVWPEIISKNSEAHLHVCGTIQDQFSDSYPRVQWLGFTNDLIQQYEEASVIIVPLLAGSGVKIKIVEAIGFGKAIVSTSIGCQGLDFLNPDDLLQADDPFDFARSVIDVLENKQLRNSLEKKMMKAAEKFLSPEVCYQPLLERLMALTAEIRK